MAKLTGQLVVAGIGAFSVLALALFSVGVALPSWDHECKPASAGQFAAPTSGELCRKAGLWEYCIRDDTNTTLTTFTRALEKDEWECADVDTGDMDTQFGIRYKWRVAQVFSCLVIILAIVNLGVLALRFCSDGTPKENTYRKAYLAISFLIVVAGVITTICWYDIGASGNGTADLQSLRKEAPVPAEFETAFNRERDEGSYGWSFALFIGGWLVVLLSALLSELALASTKPAPALMTKDADALTPGQEEEDLEDEDPTSVI